MEVRFVCIILALCFWVLLIEVCENQYQDKFSGQINVLKCLKAIRDYKSLFANKTFIVSFKTREPFVMLRNSPKSINQNNTSHAKTINELKGIVVEIFAALMQTFQFDAQFIETRDNLFGSQLVNGSWTGVVGDVARGEAHVALTALSVTMARAKAIDFTRAYFVESAAILMPTPDEVQNWFAILAPFEARAWIVLLVTVSILVFLLAYMTKLEKDLHQNERVLASNDLEEKMNPSKINLQQFYYGVNCVLAILLLRDIQRPPRESAPRILACVWWLCAIVIVNIYNGILFGQLVVPQRSKSISSIDELIEQSDLKWSVTRGSALYDLFANASPKTLYARVGASMVSVSNADEGVLGALKNKVAFIREKSILKFKIAEIHKKIGSCKLELAKDGFFSVGFAIGLAKHSPYLKAIDSALALLIENGFIARWQQIYFPTQDDSSISCELDALKEGEPLSMKHFASIFVLCGSLMLIALIILTYQHAHVKARVHISQFVAKRS